MLELVTPPDVSKSFKVPPMARECWMQMKTLDCAGTHRRSVDLVAICQTAGGLHIAPNGVPPPEQLTTHRAEGCSSERVLTRRCAGQTQKSMQVTSGHWVP